MRSLRSLAFGSLGVAVFLVGVVASGCVNNENERTLELAVGTRCTLNSDCTDPNVCVFGVCHAQCNTSADCEHGERCVKGEDSGNVCQLTSEATCEATADCVGSQVCGVDGKCRDGCKAATDCLTGQVCAQGTCADQAEVDTTTGKLPEDPDHTGEGQPCVYNTDCPDQLTCVASTCAFECNGDKDCQAGTTCVEHRCTLPTVVTPECKHDVDCGAGFLCTADKCVAGCKTDAGCTIGTRCFDGQCEKPVFDAAGTPDAVTVADGFLYAIYNQKVLRCPATGCNPTNVETLFDAPSPFGGGEFATKTILKDAPWKNGDRAARIGFGAPRIDFGATPKIPKDIPLATQRFDDPTFDLLVDGTKTFAVTPACCGGDQVWGCFDSACNQFLAIELFGNSIAAALREEGASAVLYRAVPGEGTEVSSCPLDVASQGCGNGVFFYPYHPNGYITSLAVKKGLTSSDDVVYLGWSDGIIESWSIADCLGESCNAVDVATVVDGIGQPTEVGNLRFDGDDLYWLTAEDAGNGTSYKVQRCSTAGATCTPTTLYSGFGPFTPMMAVSAGTIFVQDDGNVYTLTAP